MPMDMHGIATGEIRHVQNKNAIRLQNTMHFAQYSIWFFQVFKHMIAIDFINRICLKGVRYFVQIDIFVHFCIRVFRKVVDVNEIFFVIGPTAHVNFHGYLFLEPVVSEHLNPFFNYLTKIEMKEVFLVSSEKKNKAELELKKDDLVSRGSITVRTAESLGIKEDGYFIVVDASEEALKRAEEIMKDLGTKYKDGKKVIEKIDEQESSAMEGFGNILG